MRTLKNLAPYLRFARSVRSLWLAGSVVLAGTTAQAIVTTPSLDAGLLANSILSPGMTLASPVTLLSAPTASGTFTNGLSSGIGIDRGLVLSTGDVSLITNTNDSDEHGVPNGFAGDAALTLLAGQPTLDATALSFSFQTTTRGDVGFNFVFASEEYNEYVNLFNDTFAFYIDDENIALIPGTSDPVSVKNINTFINTVYFNDNDPAVRPGVPPFDFSFDGFTTVLTASKLNLDPGIHTLRVAIADAGADAYGDSAVFIEAATFTAEDMPAVPDTISPVVLSLFSLLSLASLRSLLSSRLNRMP